MPAVLVALYDSYAAAERVRTDLVQDGFPTDRVELTSEREPGTAGLIAAEPVTERYREYFQTLMDEPPHRRLAKHLADRVAAGAATVTVHPRGEQEIARATHILERNAPLEVDREHLDDTLLEHAASTHRRSLVLQLIEGDPRHPLH
ncbi:MAG: hypothetical protein ACREUG_13055 [Steroidobacteraceae bacterium]